MVIAKKNHDVNRVLRFYLQRAYTGGMKTIPERIEQSGATNREIAQACGVEQSVVLHWRRGKTNPHIRFIRALSAILHCEPDDLIPAAV